MSVEFSTLRHRVLLQKPLLSADGGGGVSVQWLDVAEVWAEVTPTASRQTRRAAANTNPVRQRIRLRWGRMCAKTGGWSSRAGCSPSRA